jgi:hypothetical protein
LSRPLRIALLSVVALLAAAALAFWLLFPRHRIAPVTIAGVTQTSQRIDVTFFAPEDLDRLRKRLRVGFITATLFACDDRETATREVVTQGDGYFIDRGRVEKRQPIDNQGHKYGATFDATLARTDDNGRIRLIPPAAAPGGLCFALEGGSQFTGRIWSDPIRLPARSGP